MKSVLVSEYMNHRPLYFFPEMTVAQAVEKLVQSGQQGGAVIDAQHKVIGFLSEQDCLRVMLEAAYQNEMHAVVADLMHKPAETVSPTDNVYDVAQRMMGAKPKVYPVVDEHGILVGVINRSVLLKVFDRHQHEVYKAGPGHRYV